MLATEPAIALLLAKINLHVATASKPAIGWLSKIYISRYIGNPVILLLNVLNPVLRKVSNAANVRKVSRLSCSLVNCP